VELGVSTGERTEADPLIVSAGPPDRPGTSDRAVTERILALADGAGYRAALIDAADGTVTGWPRFAWTVRAAAHGLSRRGLAEGDTAGVFVGDAASAAIAVNAIRAAGATACLIGAGSGPADIAVRLNACGARLLITSAPLAELAAEGADRSRVRQVIAFGEAAGTTPFSSLLESGRHGVVDGHVVADEPGRPEGNRLAGARSLADEHETEGSGSAAGPGSGPWPGRAAARSLDEAGPAAAPGPGRELTYHDLVVAAPPCGEGPAYISLLDLTLLTGAVLVAAPLPLVTAAMRAYRGTAAIVPHGTEVPGTPASRVFTVALSRSRTRRRLGRDGLFPRPRRGCRRGREPPGPDEHDDDQQAAHVEDGGEAERRRDAVGDHVLGLGVRGQARQRVTGRVPDRGAVHGHEHAEAQRPAGQLEHVHQAGGGPGVRRGHAGQRRGGQRHEHQAHPQAEQQHRAEDARPVGGGGRHPRQPRAPRPARPE